MDVRNKVLVGVVSATLISGVALWEGDKRTPYEDLAGIMTVCYGHTGPDIVKGKKYTEAECKALLDKDLRKHRMAVHNCTNVPLTYGQFDAFTMFAYNVGNNAFCNASLTKKLNKGDYKGACDGLLQWSYVKGKFVQGLRNRREFERKMCLGE